MLANLKYVQIDTTILPSKFLVCEVSVRLFPKSSKFDLFKIRAQA